MTAEQRRFNRRPNGAGAAERGGVRGDSIPSLSGAGEVVAGGEGVGVVGAQDALAVGEGLFEQIDGLFESARVLVGAGEVVS